MSPIKPPTLEETIDELKLQFSTKQFEIVEFPFIIETKEPTLRSPLNDEFEIVVFVIIDPDEIEENNPTFVPEMFKLKIVNPFPSNVPPKSDIGVYIVAEQSISLLRI